MSINPQHTGEVTRDIPMLYMAYGWDDGSLGDFTYETGISEAIVRSLFTTKYPWAKMEGVLQYSLDGYKNP